MLSLNELGLQFCNLCELSGKNYGKPDQPPTWRRPSQKVDGEGPLPCDVLFLGEGPGENEDREGVPFVGDSGKFLRSVIVAAGLSKLRIRISNVVRCRPPGNRAPTPLEIRACTKWLDLELGLADPKVIVCLGKSAMSYFFTDFKFKGKVGDYVGRELPLGGELAIGAYHPAARMVSQRNAILPVLRKVAAEKFGILPPPERPTDYQLLVP